MESSCAVVDKNHLFQNLEAQIALGGNNSVNTCLIQNTIVGGQFEGIFLGEAGQAWIFGNTLSENQVVKT